MQRDLRTTYAQWAASHAAKQERVRHLDAELDWRMWVRHRLALYWYAVLAVFVDIAIVATVLSVLPRPAGSLPYGIALAVMVPALYVEYEVYRVLWPSEEAVLEAAERKRADPAKAPRRPAPGAVVTADPGPGEDGRPPPET